MSTTAAFCFFPSKPATVLLRELNSSWAKGAPYRFAYLENAQDPREHYTTEHAPNVEPSAFGTFVEQRSEIALKQVIQHLEMAGSPGNPGSRTVEGEARGPGWICKIGEYYSSEQDLNDFLAAARVVMQGSTGRFIFLRDSYSLASPVWTARPERIQLSDIAQFPPNPDSREFFKVIR